MKKLILTSVMGLLVAATMFSCKKSSTSPGPNISASINGTVFKNSYCTDTVFDSILIVSGTKNFDSASNVNSYPFLVLAIFDYTGKGTYTIGTNLFTTFALDSTATTNTSAVSGTITITGTSPVSGTFSGVLDDGRTVTNGTFTANK